LGARPNFPESREGEARASCSATGIAEALNGAVTEPAWKSKPSWYLVATNDKMILPDAQRAISKRAASTVVEVNGFDDFTTVPDSRPA